MKSERKELICCVCHQRQRPPYIAHPSPSSRSNRSLSFKKFDFTVDFKYFGQAGLAESRQIIFLQTRTRPSVESMETRRRVSEHICRWRRENILAEKWPSGSFTLQTYFTASFSKDRPFVALDDRNLISPRCLTEKTFEEFYLKSCRTPQSANV